MSLENGPLSSAASGSSQVTPRSQVHALPQHAPALVQVTPLHGAIARHPSAPSHTVPGPHWAAPQDSVGPAREQAASAARQLPLSTSHTCVGPHGSGSCPKQLVTQTSSTHIWFGSEHAPQPIGPVVAVVVLVVVGPVGALVSSLVGPEVEAPDVGSRTSVEAVIGAVLPSVRVAALAETVRWPSSPQPDATTMMTTVALRIGAC